MKVLDILKHQLKNDRLSHAYIIFGKVDIALIAKILTVNTADLIELKENPVKIDHIRELIHWITLKPHSSKNKLAVIHNIENLTLDAANCLLKTLEEPPSCSIIIMTAAKKEKILPTIESRCQKLYQKNEDEVEIGDFVDFKKIGQMSIKERFDYANKLSENPDLNKIIDLWEKSFREELLAGHDKKTVLKEIVKARGLLLTNTSVKLLLENLLLKF
ncbi:MAG: hypothetical protein US94_C0003G0014 [Berkelbacteria bacterium GW2011_GWB1_38_5]|uniref:Polymerase III, delta prime subunit protein n=2 Tax=Candidatus Berkelbacteria TaxID=1618330 RepID=A0A0G0PP08_9BACT|nr:MAG: hypothetical protein US94_C0003G0014 [Berkelbacteria bacterium GW2011_GWB1_38_5]KKQ91066.1 MAG: hypothetical protein UT15_C0001G0046 [Berkelbacteria bacterium GW2011_GWA1_39_10]